MLHARPPFAIVLQIELRLRKVDLSVSWPTLEASNTRPAANWALPTEPPKVCLTLIFASYYCPLHGPCYKTTFPAACLVGTM